MRRKCFVKSTTGICRTATTAFRNINFNIENYSLSYEHVRVSLIIQDRTNYVKTFLPGANTNHDF